MALNKISFEPVGPFQPVSNGPVQTGFSETSMTDQDNDNILAGRINSLVQAGSPSLVNPVQLDISNMNRMVVPTPTSSTPISSTPPTPTPVFPNLQVQPVPNVPKQTVSLSSDGFPLADLSGNIMELDWKNKTMQVLAPKMNKRFTVDYSQIGFMKVSTGDNISGRVKILDKQTISSYQLQNLPNTLANLVIRSTFVLSLVEPPFIMIPIDPESLCGYFVKALRKYHFGNFKAYQLYQLLASESGSSEAVCSYLSTLSSHYLKTGDKTILVKLTGLMNEDMAVALMLNWHKERSLRRLYCLGLNNKEIRGAKMSLDEIYQKCLINPFTVLSLSINKAKEIFRRMNKTYTYEQELCGSITRKIQEYNRTGWAGVPMKNLLKDFPRILEYLEPLVKEYNVRYDLELVYLPYPYMVETTIADKIARMLSKPGFPPRVCKYRSDRLTPEQMVAVQGAMNNWFSIITGKAGTGKTTIIDEIVYNLELLEIPYILTSFTGMAVYRIREVVGKSGNGVVMTMHQLINKGRNVPDFKIVIIDEATMVSGGLFYEFGETFDWKFQLIMIGDKNQLRPIEFGTPFEEIYNLAISRPELNIPVFKLSKIHRTKTEEGVPNGIVFNSNSLVDYNEARVKNDMLDDDNESEREILIPFRFANFQNFTMVNSTELKHIYDILRMMFHQGARIEEIALICPYNKWVDKINLDIQQMVNGDQILVHDSRQWPWRLRDRVVMLVNNHDIGIFNGHQGKITDIVDHQTARAKLQQEWLNYQRKIQKTDGTFSTGSYLPPLDDPEPGYIEVTFEGGAVHRFYLKINEKEDAEDDDDNEEGSNDVVAAAQTREMTEKENPQLPDQDRRVRVKRLSVKLLSLAFCLTVHKMQGGQRKYIITYIPPPENENKKLGHRTFLDANLVYTMITRPQECIFCIGRVLDYNAAAVYPPKLRCERLGVRIAKQIGIMPSNAIIPIIEKEPVEQLEYHPESSSTESKVDSSERLNQLYSDQFDDLGDFNTEIETDEQEPDLD